MLQKLFGFDPQTMTVKKEVIGGITTFLTMAYILAVNPSILSAAGMDQGAVFTTTIVASVLATLVMALYAKTSTGQKMLGFWVQHLNEDKKGDALKGYVVNIDELEQKTGIDFFCNLDDSAEEQLESKKTDEIISAWGL